jgi:hypothetical protein
MDEETEVQGDLPKITSGLEGKFELKVDANNL